MGNLCKAVKVFNGAANALTVYADSAFTITKSRFITGTAGQTNMYIGCPLTIGPDADSTTAYTGYLINSVERICSGGACTNQYVGFSSGDIHDVSADPEYVKFWIPVLGFSEVTGAVNDISYTIRLSVSLLFSDNSKRNYVAELPMKRAAGSTVETLATGTVEFINSDSNQQVGNTGVATAETNDQGYDSKREHTTNSIAIAALIVGIVAFVAAVIVAGAIIYNKKKAAPMAAAAATA